MRPYIIRIASQKGGVGKTTVAVNLAMALAYKGYDVLLVDADTTNPACGFHLGMDNSNSGYYDVIRKRVDVLDMKRFISIHTPSGVHVLNGRIDSKPFIISFEEADWFVNKISKLSYDFVIIDTQPGFYYPKIAELADETIFVTTPDMPSCMSTIKLSIEANRGKAKHSLLINRVQGKRYELNNREIANMYEGRLLGSLPEDPAVQAGIAEQIPVYLSKKRSPFSRSIMGVAEIYALNKPGMETKQTIPKRRRISSLFWRKR